MSFDTIQYYIFFPLFFILYWLFPFRLRIPLMLIASYYFYSCVKPIYLVLIIFSTLVDFLCSRQIEKTTNKKLYLWISLVVNLGLLSLFKYLDFGITVVNDIAHFLGYSNLFEPQKLEFPIGISFYTLQTLSYTFDVFRGKIPAEKNIFKFSLFVCFFPQLVAGPLERAGHLLPQFNQKRHFDYDRAVDGCLLILWGLIKKTIVSDRLILIIADIYQNTHHSYSGMHFAIVGFMISAKFYGDFSGYSDMAVGSAKLLGYDLSRNFDYPFWSTNISDFWRRWHVTLSTWLHDYIYKLFPVNHSNKNDPMRIFGILAVFIVSGTWHGPNWTFIIWGLLNGIFCVLYIQSKGLRSTISRYTGIQFLPTGLKFLCAVFLTNLFVAFTMIFFMSPSLAFAAQFIKQIKYTFTWLSLADFYNAFGIYQFDIIISFTALLLIEMLNLAHSKGYAWTRIREQHVMVRWPLYILALSIFLIFSYEKKSAFSYFYY